MPKEKEVTYKVIYLDPTAAPDIIKAYGLPRWNSVDVVTLKIGHANGHDNFLTLYGVADLQEVQ